MERRRDARWKSPALKKYGDRRPLLSVKSPNRKTEDVKQVCRKADLYDGIEGFVGFVGFVVFVVGVGAAIHQRKPQQWKAFSLGVGLALANKHSLKGHMSLQTGLGC